MLGFATSFSNKRVKSLQPFDLERLALHFHKWPFLENDISSSILEKTCFFFAKQSLKVCQSNIKHPVGYAHILTTWIGSRWEKLLNIVFDNLHPCPTLLVYQVFFSVISFPHILHCFQIILISIFQKLIKKSHQLNAILSFLLLHLYIGFNYMNI